MYRFSRSIYRELAPRVVEDEWDPTGCANKQKVLEACEGAICRLTYDGRYFARPARTLFNDVRTHFTMRDQLFVWTVIQRNIGLALEFLSRLPEGSGSTDGRHSATRIRARARHVSAGRFPATTTARRTGTWRRRSRGSSCRSRLSTASSRRPPRSRRQGRTPARGRGPSVPAPGPPVSPRPARADPRDRLRQ